MLFNLISRARYVNPESRIYAILSANPDMVKELKHMARRNSALARALEESGWAAEWEERGEARGEAKGIVKGKAEGIRSTLYVIKGLKNNVPIDRLAEESQLPVEEIEKIKSEL
jgi:predicted transposase YdaD